MWKRKDSDSSFRDVTHHKKKITQQNGKRKNYFCKTLHKYIFSFETQFFILAPLKTLVKFLEWSDPIFTVFARSGATGTWAPIKFGRLRVKWLNEDFVYLQHNDRFWYFHRRLFHRFCIEIPWDKLDHNLYYLGLRPVLLSLNGRFLT